ncbi:MULTISPECIES: hypothetical protein [Streptomyces]|uniref:Uncharacterized protein n=1 Tax=Streptomyces xanthii TaxID=2768069 RepID=A0A7H1B451_9ACTN|nr:hypothetical protein [Streptomyces xanthii]QNS03506.1 hypothetical protein IAG42_07565 [Streptomyces xanthii]
MNDDAGPPDPAGWWARADEATRRAVDADVLRDRFLFAVRTLWEALRHEGLGLNAAQDVVAARYETLGDRVERRRPDPLDVPALTARAAAHPGRVVAIEAVWDGDTVHDWFVELVAILDSPSGEASLALIHENPGPRATEAGQALATHLGVPFRFPPR